MKLSLNEFKNNDDVIGAFVADGANILISCMPDNYSNTQVNAAIDVCSKSIIGTKIGSFSTKRITYNLQSSILIAQHIGDHVFLFILCHPVKDIPLLDIYINIVADQIQSHLEEKERKSKLPNLDELKAGHLGQTMGRVQDWLSNYLGPVASIVIDDALETWIAQGNPDSSHLEGLFLLLDEELEPNSQKQLRKTFEDLL